MKICKHRRINVIIYNTYVNNMYLKVLQDLFMGDHKKLLGMAYALLKMINCFPTFT